MPNQNYIKYVRLEHHGGTSNKFYIVWIEKKPGFGLNGYSVNFHYGRIGLAGNFSTKTPSPVNINMADKVFDNLVYEKKRKGYKQVDSTIPSTKPAMVIDPGMGKVVKDKPKKAKKSKKPPARNIIV